jgi:hypothetical protein
VAMMMSQGVIVNACNLMTSIWKIHRRKKAGLTRARLKVLAT